MATFRDIKRKARLTLHERLAEPAIYVTWTDPNQTSFVMTGVLVRLHLNFSELGELLRGGFADRQELSPKIVFVESQMKPTRNGIIITRDLGAWRVDNTLPPNDITVSAEVLKMTDSEVEKLGWTPGVQYLGLGTPDPGAIQPIDPLPIQSLNWDVDEW